ncbi:hemolysin family protein [Paenibacillus agricola]|uniref:HlyC/CorC family transporter n=1 Tax=Paenibacillus agricola TaxID=2716264 RepID=A0ABX0JF01_9BACL|nr:hemolysin family protein [Paenibacillus agricola]NHN34478.1 HlyC/CorC family transporter [Paenibacillus agricola]
MIGLNVLMIFVLLLLTAFFVAAEFSFIRIRPSRVDQLILEGNKKALAVKRVTSNLDGYLSACQLGITITALGLGWLGEPTVELMLHPLIANLNLPSQVVSTLSFLIAFGLVTFLHVVLGELAPKSVAIQKAEAVSMVLAMPMITFYKIMYPAIWLLNGSATQFIKLFGMKPANEHEEAHSEEELRIILSESYESGEINQAEYGYVSRIFDFDELKAREIMVPRTEMVCLYIHNTLEENINIIKEEQYTRFPVAGESKDDILGMINTKQFFLKYVDTPQINLIDLINPVLSVPESLPVKKLLKEMQKQNAHIVMLLDEYGGTAGMITIEDVLEEIVGEIRDEFDSEEKPEIEQFEDKLIIVDGKVPISDINDIFGSDLDQSELDTIGGWLYAKHPLLREGMEWNFDVLSFKILKKDGLSFRKIEIKPLVKTVTAPPKD